MAFILVPRALLQEGIHAYDDEAAKRKAEFHRQGKRFLQDLAKGLGLLPSQYEIRNNKGGIAVSGEVLLHADRLYVQMSERAGPFPSGITILYRSCRGRRDYTGGVNNFVSAREMADERTQAKVIRKMMNAMRVAQSA